MTKDELKFRILDDYNLGPMHIISLVEAYIEGKPLEKSLMKLAEDLGVPFSAAKIIHDHALIEKQSIPDNIAEAIGASKVIDLKPKVSREFVERWVDLLLDTTFNKNEREYAVDFLTDFAKAAGVEVEDA